MKTRIGLIILTLSLIFLPARAFAQEESTPASELETIESEDDALDLAEEEADESAQEGLLIADFATDLKSEILPTSGLAYFWENFLFGLRRAFTFNAEKKAALDRERLHRLDRKLAACAEIGDEKCLEKVKSQIERFTKIAKKHLEKKEELKAKHLKRFEEWRKKREEKAKELKEKMKEQERRGKKTLEKRKLKRREILKRQKRIQQQPETKVRKRIKDLEERKELRNLRNQGPKELGPKELKEIGPREMKKPGEKGPRF